MITQLYINLERKWSWQTGSAGSFQEKKIYNIIRGATGRDLIYSTVYSMILNGWPEHIHRIPHIICHFWGIREVLTVENGILLKGNRICIPPELYDRTLSKLHRGHNDIEKMQHLTMDTFYWPGMNTDIAKYIKRCNICTQFKATQAVQLTLPRDIPEGPWQDLATNFFKHNNAEYILIADPFRKYPFIFKTTSKTEDTIIQKFKQLISQYRPPKRLSTENGPHLLQTHSPSSSQPKELTTAYHHHIT